jgi:50S ribosomal protein L16 3-hydroxylase
MRFSVVALNVSVVSDFLCFFIVRLSFASSMLAGVAQSKVLASARGGRSRRGTPLALRDRMATPGLAPLLRPLSEARFLREHWPVRHAAMHGDRARFGELARLPALADVDALLAAWRGNVTAVLDSKGDEHRSVSVGVREAALLYADGLNLVFNRAEEHVPELRAWLAAITGALGISTLVAARCIVYASPDDRGASPHFDTSANFVLQLRGTKTWQLAPNRSITHPIERYAMNMPAIPREVERHAHARLPARMPRDAETVTLRPGSFLFVPRGTWHATRAGGESLSLNFTFSQPTWADLICDALRRRLSRDPRWRELADGVAGASPARRAAAVRRLGELVASFGGEALEPDALIADVLDEAPVGDTSSFRRRRDVAMTVRRDSLVLGGASIAIDRDAAPFFRWLAARTRPVTMAQLRRRAGSRIAAAAMPAVISTLVAARAFARC